MSGVEHSLDSAIRLHQAGRLGEAALAYEGFLHRSADNAAALSNYSDVLRRLHRLPKAIEACERAIRIDPAFAAAHHNLALALLDASQFDRAAESLQRCVELRLRTPRVMLNLANAMRRAGRLDEAVNAYREALQLDPTSGEAWNNLGSVLQSRGELDEAARAFQQAIVHSPELPQPHSNLGIIRREQGKLPEAIESHRRAVVLESRSVGALCNLSATLAASSGLDEAEDVCRRAIAYMESSALAHNNLANVLSEQGRVDEALAEYRASVRYGGEANDAALPAFHSNLLYAMQFAGADTPEEILAEYKRWDQLYAKPLARHVASTSTAEADRPLRIGYVSPDFSAHPVGRFILPAIVHHDRAQFHVTCYHTASFADALTGQMQSSAERWRVVAALPHEKLAQQIREDQIDILIDLSGHTSNHRLLTFAQSPAPVQATYLGYPDTTGMSAMHWRITDGLADPIGTTECWHAEKLARLPTCAWCFVPPPQADAQPKRERRGQVTFGSFNKLGKISVASIDLWSNVLNATPTSRILLKARGLVSERARTRLMNLFAQRGIDSSRLELRSSTPSIGEHFAMYGEIDVALDTFPYCGTTTTCESLWMGVPVVTLAGQRHVSRVGTSLLHNAGAEELIAEDEDSYVRIATELAADEVQRDQYRCVLRDRIRSSPLTDAMRFTRELEATLRVMWLHHRVDQQNRGGGANR